jgi:protein tyrosine/serine phosphatase
MDLDGTRPVPTKAADEMNAPGSARSWTNRAVRGIAITLFATTLVGGGYLSELHFAGNFHTVVAGQVYRSAQMTPKQIDASINTYGIKTIINLRGPNVGRPWYDAEVHEAKLLGVAHIDFGMSAGRELTKVEADRLIALMKTAQKPVLIHCSAGSDRSGLASALYLAAIERAGDKVAEAQLSFRFGHISLPFVAAYAMDRTLEKLEPSFKSLGPDLL